MARSTPESLRLAADKVEEADAARKVALEAEKKANDEKAKAATADTNADAALVKAGVGVDNGNAKDTTKGGRGAGNGNNGNNGNNGGQSNSAGDGGIAKAVAYIALGIAILAIVAAFVLSLVKPSQSFVDFIAVTAKEARDLATDAQSKIGILKKDVDQIATVANAANDKADKALNKPCSVCEKEEVILPSKPKSKPASKPVHKPRPQKPVTPAPAAVGKVTPECTDCKPTPEFIPRKQVASPEGYCGIVAEEAKTQKVIAKFMLQPYSGEKDMSRKGNLQIMQVAEFKMGEIHRIEGAITMVKHTDCLQAIKYVESQWPKVVKNFKLPDDCLPVRYGS